MEEKWLFMNIYSFIIDRFGYEVYLKGRYYPSSFITPLGMNTLEDRYVHHFRVKDRGGNFVCLEIHIVYGGGSCFNHFYER